MKIRILRDASVQQLRDAVLGNLSKYRNGDFAYLDMDSTQFHELPVETQDGALADIKMADGDHHFEVENCVAVHQYLGNLSPYEARDERLWCHLSHTTFLNYARSRWPIPDDDAKAVSHILTHFFASANRQIERDNVVSRLWWMAHLCTRVDGVSQIEALKAFLYRTDVRASIIERPTVAQSTNVFSVILKGLMKSSLGQKALFERNTFRKVMQELNSVGGFRLLDALPENELDKIFDDVIAAKVGLTSL
jgi:hypothetical protein